MREREVIAIFLCFLLFGLVVGLVLLYLAVLVVRAAW